MIEMSKLFDCLKHSTIFFPSKNKGINRLRLGVTVRFASLSLINDLDEMLGCKWSSLSPIHPIKEGALRFHHVTHEEEASHNAGRLIFIECSRCNHVFTGVHQACLISAAITSLMNG